MFSTKSLAAVTAALSLIASSAAGSDANLAVYWGQGPDQLSLSHYCQQTSIDIIPIGFINKFPQQTGNSDPAIPAENFGNACYGLPLYNGTELYQSCPNVTEGIPICQQMGKKVLLSLGGNSSTYQLTGPQAGEDFADYLWSAYGPYDADYVAAGGIRPFDGGRYNADGTTIDIDGFDFDIEIAPTDDAAGYVALIKRLREHFTENPSKEYIISGAPQCYLPEANMGELITKARFDILWIQFYNNPSCSVHTWANANTDYPITKAVDAGFNFDSNTTSSQNWVDFVSTGASADAKLYIGLSASPTAAETSDYLSPTEAKQLITEFYDAPQFGGIMLWEATAAENNLNGGSNYYDLIKSYLAECSPPTASSTISSTSATAAATSSSTAITTTTTPTSTSAATSSITSAESTTTSEASSSSTTEAASSSTSAEASSTTTSESASSTTSDVSSSSTSEEASSSTTSNSASASTSDIPSSTSDSVSSTTSESASTTSDSASSTISDSASSTTSDSTSTTSEISSSTTSQSYPSSSEAATSSTASSTVIYYSSTESASPTSSTASFSSSTVGSSSTPSSLVSSSAYTSSTVGSSSTPSSLASSSAYTSSTVGSSSTPSSQVSSSAYTSSTAAVSEPVSSTSSLPSSTTTVSYTTSTVRETLTYTITSCAPTVTDCPGKIGSVTTQTVDLYTTVCPVSETEGSSAALSTSTPVISTAPKSTTEYTTSTVQTTKTYTITSCAPEITDCPGKIGSVTTETIDLYTTVCPVTATEVSLTFAPTITPGPVEYTTSTVYTTSIYTITSCAPTVTNCPAKIGQVTTEVAIDYTTVCPVSEASPTTAPGEIFQESSVGPLTTHSTTHSTTILSTNFITYVTVKPQKSTMTVQPVASTPVAIASSPAAPYTTGSASSEVKAAGTGTAVGTGFSSLTLSIVKPATTSAVSPATTSTPTTFTGAGNKMSMDMGAMAVISFAALAFMI